MDRRVLIGVAAVIVIAIALLFLVVLPAQPSTVFEPGYNQLSAKWQAKDIDLFNLEASEYPVANLSSADLTELRSELADFEATLTEPDKDTQALKALAQAMVLKVELLAAIKVADQDVAALSLDGEDDAAFTCQKMAQDGTALQGIDNALEKLAAFDRGLEDFGVNYPSHFSKASELAPTKGEGLVVVADSDVDKVRSYLLSLKADLLELNDLCVALEGPE